MSSCAPKRQHPKYGSSCFTSATLKFMLQVLYTKTLQAQYRPNTKYGGLHKTNDHRKRAGMIKTVHEAAAGVPEQKWLVLKTPEALKWWQENPSLLRRMRSELNPASKAYTQKEWLSADDISDKLIQFSDYYNWRFLNLEVYSSHTVETTSRNICKRIEQNWAKTRRYSSFAFVLNTAPTKKGSHWVCVFFKRKPKRIEYFDPMGNLANDNVMRIITNVQKCLGTDWVFENNRGPQLQKKDTECGMYVLYYIKQRLLGKLHTSIIKSNMSDAKICALRKHYFTDLAPTGGPKHEEKDIIVIEDSPPLKHKGRELIVLD